MIQSEQPLGVLCRESVYKRTPHARRTHVLRMLKTYLSADNIQGFADQTDASDKQVALIRSLAGKVQAALEAAETQLQTAMLLADIRWAPADIRILLQAGLAARWAHMPAVAGNAVSPYVMWVLGTKQYGPYRKTWSHLPLTNPVGVLAAALAALAPALAALDELQPGTHTVFRALADYIKPLVDQAEADVRAADQARVDHARTRKTGKAAKHATA